jgi:putative transposase
METRKSNGWTINLKEWRWKQGRRIQLKRDEKEHRVIAYVLNNPVKAGLVKDWREWPWSWKRL